jgi:hypothetical protein
VFSFASGVRWGSCGELRCGTGFRVIRPQLQGQEGLISRPARLFVAVVVFLFVGSTSGGGNSLQAAVRSSPSPWNVNEESTSFVMEPFYTSLKKGPLEYGRAARPRPRQ